MSKIELLAPAAARTCHGQFLYPGERLVVVDGAVWGVTKPHRVKSITKHYLFPIGSRSSLEGQADGYGGLKELVEARIADGSLPAAFERWQVAETLRREMAAAAERAQLARQQAEEAEWRERAQQTVGREVAGYLTPAELQALVDRIIDAMRWARRR